MRTAYETCSYCRGYGIIDTMDGAGDCWECEGSGQVRARDSKGRFITKEIPENEAF